VVALGVSFGLPICVRTISTFGLLICVRTISTYDNTYVATLDGIAMVPLFRLA
jgi:hypothetical protein